MSKKIKTIHKDISMHDFMDIVSKSKNASVGFDMMGISSGYEFDNAKIAEGENGITELVMGSVDNENFFKLNMGMPGLKYKIVSEDKNYSEISLQIEDLPFITVIIFLGF